ncbi:MAG: class I SAM-dependent methyltransferase [Victivallaceae bacterium]
MTEHMDIKEFKTENHENERHFWEIAKTAFVLTMIRKYRGKFSSALDIGCGDCYVISQIAANFPEVNCTGADPALTPKLIGFFRKKLSERGLDVEILNKIPDKEFDAVFMFDVLEHLKDDRGHLKNLPQLKPGGILFITVPAFQCLFSGHDEFLEHYRRYNRRQLLETVAVSGLQILESGYFFCSLLPLRWLQKISRKKYSADTVAPVAVINRLLAFCLQADAAFGYFMKKLKIQIPGLSCYVICQKPLS